jgi:hypothetical protein
MNQPVDLLGIRREPVVGCVPVPSDILGSDNASPQAVPMSDRLATLGEQGCYPRFHRTYYYRYIEKN